MQRNLFSYIWQNTRRDQIWILGIILASMPIYFLSLDLPKRIVNGPIQGQGFETPGATERFFQISFTPPYISDTPITLFSGVELERLPYLIALSLLFLCFVCLNGYIKFYINTFKGRLGERMLRRLRFELIDRILRFPHAQFRRMKAPEVASMVKDEVEPLGGFIGDAFVSPVFLGGQALTAMVFILAQSLALGMIALSIVLMQAFLIPRLRRRLLVLGKERQLTARALAGRVGEIVDGIAEVHTNDTSNYERADISGRLGKIFFIRFEFYQRKFFVKFLNNFLAQVTPFLFYLIGGYLAIRGQLDIGQLVAVIAAYKDLPSPIKELIDWDQQRLDVQIKFNQVMEQFAPDNMLDPEIQSPHFDTVPAIAAPLVIERLSVTDETGAKLLENVSLTMRPGERVAVVGGVNAGGETVSEVIARLLLPTTGTIRIDGKDLATLPEAVTGRRFAYLGSDVYLPNISVRDCLLYGLRHAPPKDDGSHNDESRRRDVAEAEASGNTIYSIDDNWTDYASAGVSDDTGLLARIDDVLRILDMQQDIYQLGLRGRLEGPRLEATADALLTARAELRAKLAQSGMEKLVEPFDPDRYNTESTVGLNLLFGTATSDLFAPEKLPANPYMLAALKETGLDEELFRMGREIAETVIELFGDLPGDHPFFEQLSFMTAEEIPDYRQHLKRTSGKTFADVKPKHAAALLRLAYDYIEPRHRLGLLTEDLKERIVSARAVLHDRLTGNLKGAVDFYEPNAYNAASSLQDNILFGRIAYGLAEAPARVREAIQGVLDDLNMQAVVFEAGLDFEVGTGGKRLTTSQRQKLGLARALLKRPDLLIVNRALSALDARNQRAIGEHVLRLAAGTPDATGFGTFWVLMNASFAQAFDRVLVFEDGQLVEDGPPEDLIRKDGRFARLIAA